MLADALEQSAVALVQNSEASAPEAMEALRRANSVAERAAASGKHSWSLCGWDVRACEPREVLRVRRCKASDDGGDDGSDHSDGDEVGANARGGGCVAVEAAHVVELESTKSQALRSAVEIACALVGVDGVFVDVR